MLMPTKQHGTKKILKEHKEQLAEIVNINVVLGDSLINILYNPLNDKYSYSVVTLYYAFTKQGKRIKPIKLWVVLSLKKISVLFLLLI